MRRCSLFVAVVVVFVLAAVVITGFGALRLSQSGKPPTQAKVLHLKLKLNDKVELEFVRIEAGRFMMGSPTTEANRNAHEGPQHEVTISQPFYLGKYEVTQAQWQAVMGAQPSHFKTCGGNCPVENVSYDDVQEFLSKLNARGDGNVYRLPTEAEWEYAARAGTTTVFAFGDSLDSTAANFDGKYPYGAAAKGVFRESPIAAGSFKPNDWGLHDMHGNVYEWCQDWYEQNYYSQSPRSDPPGPVSGQYRVVRSGSWNFHAHGCRSANRLRNGPSVRHNAVGFRLAAMARARCVPVNRRHAPGQCRVQLPRDDQIIHRCAREVGRIEKDVFRRIAFGNAEIDRRHELIEVLNERVDQVVAAAEAERMIAARPGRGVRKVEDRRIAAIGGRPEETTAAQIAAKDCGNRRRVRDAQIAQVQIVTALIVEFRDAASTKQRNAALHTETRFVDQTRAKGRTQRGGVRPALRILGRGIRKAGEGRIGEVEEVRLRAEFPIVRGVFEMKQSFPVFRYDINSPP